MRSASPGFSRRVESEGREPTIGALSFDYCMCRHREGFHDHAEHRHHLFTRCAPACSAVFVVHTGDAVRCGGGDDLRHATGHGGGPTHLPGPCHGASLAHCPLRRGGERGDRDQLPRARRRGPTRPRTDRTGYPRAAPRHSRRAQRQYPHDGLADHRRDVGVRRLCATVRGHADHPLA